MLCHYSTSLGQDSRDSDHAVITQIVTVGVNWPVGGVAFTPHHCGGAGFVTSVHTICASVSAN